MARKILSVGFEFPGGEVEEIDHLSRRSLLDADIIVFSPKIPDPYAPESHQGKRCLSDNASFASREALTHWRRELSAALDAGKLVVVFLEAPEEVFAATGHVNRSGTGRNAHTTRMVEELSSYHGLPVNLTFSAAQGREMVLIPTARLLSGYWSEFGQYSAYEVFIEGKVPEILIKTKSGNRVVGACIRKGRGALLLIPALKLDEEECVEPTETGEPGDEEEDEDQVGNTASRWTKEGEIFGHKLELALVALADSISADVAATPRPDWTHGDSFRQPEESSIENSIQKISKKTLELEEERRRLESQLDASGSLRSLLYEQGKPLERAVLEALELLGFAAKRFSSDGSEFDAVFESPEGRFIGEVEGKDNRAVNIDKFSQLERNLNEDFAREEVSAHAKGVLFGNAFRLKPPTERDPAFTEKCKAAALRTGVALVSTPDLFAACRYLKSSHDADYAATCRRAIFEMRGDIVKFPEPPTGDTLAKEMELRQVENAS